jgi:hypothetical protein
MASEKGRIATSEFRQYQNVDGVFIKHIGASCSSKPLHLVALFRRIPCVSLLVPEYHPDRGRRLDGDCNSLLVRDLRGKSGAGGIIPAAPGSASRLRDE